MGSVTDADGLGLIFTLTLVLTDIFGAAGRKGLAAAMIANSDESVSKPKRLRAENSQVYMASSVSVASTGNAATSFLLLIW